MAKIIIDAGHGGTDPGAVYEGRLEKNDTLRLALAVGDLLEDCGADVVYTRTEDVYQTPLEKAQAANREGGDFFISFHRNSSAQPNQYSGVETLVYDRSGKKLEMAEAINEELAKVGFRNLGVKERPGLIVLKRTQMPALLVEAGFLNTEEDNRRFDSRFAEIAQAIARGIARVLSLSCAGDTPDGGKLYRVQTGAFRNQAYAQELLNRLLEQGYPAFILQEDGYYKVQTGAFANLENAVRMEEALRGQGYSTFITT